MWLNILLKSHLMASCNHWCSIGCSPSDILARLITNSPQYTQLQCGRNPRSVLQNVNLVYFLFFQQSCHTYDIASATRIVCWSRSQLSVGPTINKCNESIFILTIYGTTSSSQKFLCWQRAHLLTDCHWRHLAISQCNRKKRSKARSVRVSNLHFVGASLCTVLPNRIIYHN